jgi:hypothetical protein
VAAKWPVAAAMRAVVAVAVMQKQHAAAVDML